MKSILIALFLVVGLAGCENPVGSTKIDLSGQWMAPVPSLLDTLKVQVIQNGDSLRGSGTFAVMSFYIAIRGWCLDDSCSMTLTLPPGEYPMTFMGAPALDGTLRGTLKGAGILPTVISFHR